MTRLHPQVRRVIRAAALALCPMLAGVLGAGWLSTLGYESRLGLYRADVTTSGTAWTQFTLTATAHTFRVARYVGLPDPTDPGGSWRLGGEVVPLPSAAGWFTATPPVLTRPTIDWTIDRQSVTVPCWMPVSVVGVVALVQGAVWIRRRMRHRAGCCRGCGYDLSGLAAGASCPECGRNEKAGGLKSAARHTPDEKLA